MIKLNSIYKINLSIPSKKALNFLKKLSNKFDCTLFVQKKKKKHISLIRSPHVFSKSKQKLKSHHYQVILTPLNSSVVNQILNFLPLETESTVIKYQFLSK